jgi:hypothetical protein
MSYAGRLDSSVLDTVDSMLAASDAALLHDFPGPRLDRQPVHTVYVPADRCDVDVVPRWGAEARRLLDSLSAADRAAVLPPGTDVDDVWDRVRAKLEREPVEDLRVDVEDGYGTRPDSDEDADVVSAARAIAACVAAGMAPPYVGLRFRSIEASTRRRGLRSLDLFVSTLLDAGPLPTGFVLTLPKVTSVAQVEALAHVCAVLEETHGLAPGSLRFELQIEVPSAVLGADGTATLARLLRGGEGRVAAAYQSLEHPVADHAKLVMQAAVAGTGVRISDGSTNVLPVGSPDEVCAAMALHARLVRRSLERGIWQGWDMHPGHLPTRYAATYAFFLESAAPSARRVRDYRASRTAGVMDEPASVQALAAFLLRGIDCGALARAEVEDSTGATWDELRAYAGRRIG